MTNQNKTLQSLTTLVVPIACLPAFSGCSSTESTGENQRMMINLVKSVDQEHEKVVNSPAHHGPPYIMDPATPLISH